jgi:hypothetical protein
MYGIWFVDFRNALYTVLVTVIFLERWQIIFAKNKIY